jgi:predicted AAA+ superfamily ATPase
MTGQNTIVIQAMKRRAEDMLADWADQTQRKPLVLRGARQTGKTWLVKHFAERFQGPPGHCAACK